ncbi:hypothetical protein TWF718_006945 [Orbilia javanica]|uniref:Uncharacterized protein n=1 Tax=Orbilia javanica TaxID=47235 RepID=A0AAN8MTG3_9PEZI
MLDSLKSQLFFPPSSSSVSLVSPVVGNPDNRQKFILPSFVVSAATWRRVLGIEFRLQSRILSSSSTSFTRSYLAVLRIPISFRFSVSKIKKTSYSLATF